MESRTVETHGGTRRVWEQGDGPVVGYLAGLHGLTVWSPFLDALSERHRVVAPSLPGYPGGGTAEDLDDLIDWVVATLDILDAAGLAGADLIGASVGGALAAEVAALSTVGRLVLVSPLGMNVPDDPVRNQLGSLTRRPELLAADADALAAHLARPADDDTDEVEWLVERDRALATNARLLWPLLDTGVVRRLHRITAPTLVVWGEDDRIVPSRYASRFADGIAGTTTVEVLAGAGHLVDVDAPIDLAKRITDFLSTPDER